MERLWRGCKKVLITYEIFVLYEQSESPGKSCDGDIDASERENDDSSRYHIEQKYWISIYKIALILDYTDTGIH
jgi:hypothetical protein